MPHCYSYDPVYLGRTRRTAPCLILIQLYLCISLHFVIQVLDLFNLKRQDERATRWQVIVKAVVKLSVSSPLPIRSASRRVIPELFVRQSRPSIRIHVSRTCEPLRDRLVPFHNNTADSVLQQEGKNLSGDLVSDIGGGRTRNDANPYDDGTESPFRLLSQRRMGEEAGRVDGRPVDLPSLDQVTNLGTDSVPDTIERSVEDSAERLDGDVGLSADGLGKGCKKGCNEQVRTVDEVRVVAVPSAAVIIRCSLVLIGAVHGGEGGEIGRHSDARRAGAGPLALLTLEVNTLESEEGEF